MDITAIIPTFNGMEMLDECIKGLNIEIVVVDNGSTDGTVEMLLSKYPKIRIIKNSSNQGFAKAINQGARQVQSKYLLILNNDCIVEKNAILKMLSYVKKPKSFVATQPIVYSNDHIENIGYQVDTWVGKVNIVTQYHSQLSIFNSQIERYIYGLSATCLLIRRDIFLKVGMFDESFHSYLEDVDFFIRLSKKGYNYGPTLDASCRHIHMATSSKMGLYKQKQDLKNWVRIIIKNFPPNHIVKHFPSLFFERLRNLNGLLKAAIIRHI
ncbi:MAG TPA: glycosyltransferase family 2 protein [Patescibacteria group bacterium]|nr:glycosyltransferase family 2 protein [Patescibacteria group bacterium]